MRYEASEIARTGRRIYQLMFGTKIMMEDITRRRKKGEIKNRAEDLPLTPGQTCIYKDVNAYLQIMDNGPGMKTDDFLEKPSETENKRTRSAFDTLIDYNNKLTGSNHAGRSIIRRHHSLIKWILENKIEPYDLLHLPKKKRKKMIREIIDSMDTIDNQLRGQIWTGNLAL